MNDTMTDIFNSNEQVQNVEKKVEPVTTKKVDKILITQITLLIVWAVLTTVVYFFGYDLFEPFIKV